MDFHDLLKLDVDRVFTNPHEFGETVTYQPCAGPARSVQCHITSTSRYEQRGPEEVKVEELRLLCGRDAAADVGGIDAPKIGETILRDSAHDPDQKLYGFTGDTEGADPGAWILIFTATSPHRTGTSQITPR